MKVDFIVGDIVRLKAITGYTSSYGSAKRGNSVHKAVGAIGSIKEVNLSARLYPYWVEFSVPYANKKKGTYLKMVWVRKDEIEPLFIQ